MHENPAFRGASRDQIMAFAAARGFGALTVAGVDGLPLAAHAPFVLIEDGAGGEPRRVDARGQTARLSAADLVSFAPAGRIA